MSVQAWQQLSGANVMAYYVVNIFYMADLTGNIGLISLGMQYAIFIIETAATFFFIDVIGRRPLLTYGPSVVGMSISANTVTAFVLSARAYILHHFGAYRLGLCHRSMVPRNLFHRHGSRLHCILAL